VPSARTQRGEPAWRESPSSPYEILSVVQGVKGASAEPASASRSHLPFSVSPALSSALAGRFSTEATSAADPPSGAATQQPKALLPPEVAAELMYEVGWESRHRYLDVRTPEEFAKGRPEGAVNVPYMLKSSAAEAGTSLGSLKPGGLRMRENPDFLEQVLQHFPPDTRLIVGSENKGRRASLAVSLLEKQGYSHVLTMDGGQRAWAKQELPVESNHGDRLLGS